MTVLRVDIERALDELISQEEGMRFQGLAVAIGKQRWPELIAHERKKDFGLDAYASATLASDETGKGLAASLTPTLDKVRRDANTAKAHYPDLVRLLFVTPAKVGNADLRRWNEAIRQDHGIDLHIIEREEIITLLLMPMNARLCASFLHLESPSEPENAEAIERVRRAAAAVTRAWAAKTKGQPLIDLTAVRLKPDGAEDNEVLALEQIDQELAQSRRIVLEGPAGRGKTTTLMQLAQRVGVVGIAFIVEFPAWVSSRRGILEFIAGMRDVQSEGLTAIDLARMQSIKPFLFLLNGWNEVAEADLMRGSEALRELDRDFPLSGIAVTTRTHHLTPPLPGALRLRLLPLRPEQRTTYLSRRLGHKADELGTRISGDPSLDEITRTPFILSEVAALCEGGTEVPSTKAGVLTEVLRLHEQRSEHQNSLTTTPIFGVQAEYLKALAMCMIRCGAATASEAEARAAVSEVVLDLVRRGLIERVGAPTVLATLTAHHVLERVDYPHVAFRFQHQQLQEYYAALHLRAELLDLGDASHDEAGRFKAEYVNLRAWGEPLRLVAESFAAQSGDGGADERNTRAGETLVEMALAVDLVFAGELSRLCGEAVWERVRMAVGECLRAVYGAGDDNFQRCALAAMLATGATDFREVLLPLLSSDDQQIRLGAYRLRRDISVAALGPNWRDEVRGWSEEARADFVMELLFHRFDGEVAAFAEADTSSAVKRAAASALMWIGADEALTRVLGTMNAQMFQEVVRANLHHLPAAVVPKAVAVLRAVVERSADHPARLRTAADLIRLGEAGLDGAIKDALASLSGADMRDLTMSETRRALECLREADPIWVSEWIAVQVAEGRLFFRDGWLPMATAIPDHVVADYVQRLQTDDLSNSYIDGMLEIITARADAPLAAQFFVRLRELQFRVDAEPDERHDGAWQVMRQLEAVFRRLPDDVAVAGILSSVNSGNPLDIKITARLLSRVARPDGERPWLAADGLKARLRAYLKAGVDVVLRQDDFNGEEKAHLASSIAQVGLPEDIADLEKLIRADIARVRRGRAARATGDHGPLGNGGIMSYACWHIAAVTRLDPADGERVLVELLAEPEYAREAADAMAHDFVPKREHSFGQTLCYDSMWAAREGRTPPRGDEHRRARFAAALNAEIKCLLEQNQVGKHAAALKELAKALAAVDGRGSAAVVLEVIAMPGRWDEHTRLDAAERLLMAGGVLPARAVFALIGSILERTEGWTSDSDRSLFRRVLALCPLVNDPVAGIAKIRDVLGEIRLGGYELHGVVTALGESRADAAVALLRELASDAHTFEQCEAEFINALAALDTPGARELLLGFVDPEVIAGVPLRRPAREDLLAARLTELATRSPETAARLLGLCERDLPESHRQVLAKAIARLGTPEAFGANLSLIDDARPSPIPEGVRDQLERAFVERRPYGQGSGAFTLHPRASNGLRSRLFRMALDDRKRRRSASTVLGEIEVWRLEHGRPTGEPRHPDLASGQSWPLTGS